jgi:hypothetical protein
MFVKVSDSNVRPPVAISIPVPFLTNAQRMGDLVANVASAFGFQPCDGCQQRQQLLNQNFQVVPFGTWWRGGL